jgi:4-amino-4-deoxy-L-arabinose transferase-like glycosyltransferase
MSAMTDAGRRGQLAAERLVERLLDALTDPARQERTAILAVLAYVALWTLYAVIAKGGVDIHADMSEQYALARELAWGYSKHPPLAMVMVRGWFAVLPTSDWAYYLLAMATAGLALWIVWRLSARFLDGEKRVVGLALLTLVPFFNFHALKFNSNTVLMPLWAATMLWFLRSFETRRVLDAALAGLCAALAMYGKYWSVVLLLGLGIAALVDPRRGAYFRSPAPWVTVAVGALVLAPHVVWLIANDFAPLSYAVDVHGAVPLGSTLRGAFSYLAGSVAYVAMPLLLIALVVRPGPATVREMAWPADPRRRLAATAFWSVLLAPALIAPLASVHLVSIWSMSAFALLPAMLLSSPLVVIARRDAVRILALAVAFPVVMAVIAPGIALGIHRAGPFPGTVHSSTLVAEIERLWGETTDRPLRGVAGYDELTDGVAFYMRGHPLAVHLLDKNDLHAADDLIDRYGIVLLCPERARHPPSAGWCVAAADSIAARFPRGLRRNVEVSRRALGIEGEPARYLIITIPPRR